MPNSPTASILAAEEYVQVRYTRRKFADFCTVSVSSFRHREALLVPTV